MSTELRFTAAPPLGRLCRWLRTLGFDCVYLHKEGQTDSDRSSAGRIYLTRHVDPTERRVVFIGQDDVFDQLKVMNILISLKGHSDPLSRCIRCNTPLVNATPLAVKQEVPEHVVLSQSEFRRCPSCGRIFWPGTHVDRIQERIARLFG